ncbi:MAG: AAC(3) family N-acetyltransferase [Elusimicrobiota bacterium]|nr:AAC(3) family N-acetyltransferase [Elusimicrobiota bacterium]
MSHDYTRRDLAAALTAAGVREGDNLFTLSNVGYFGVPEGGMTRSNVFSTILGALQDAVGPKGTLCVPTFTYSFCRKQDFDPANSPSEMGVFAEDLRRLPGARRSDDPIFSVAALGPRAEEFTRDAPEACFGPDSFWERFLKADGLFCHLSFLMGPTMIHFVERALNVPYRQDRVFTGNLVKNGEKLPRRAVYFSRPMDEPGALTDTDWFEERVEALGLCRRVRVGRGFILAMRARDVDRFIREEIKVHPRFLTLSFKEARAGKA